MLNIKLKRLALLSVFAEKRIILNHMIFVGKSERLNADTDHRKYPRSIAVQ